MPPAPRSPKTAATPAPRGGGGGHIVLLTGAEASRKNTEAQALLNAQVDSDYADFDAEVMDGNVAAADRVLSAAATVPLGTGKRVVLVRDTQQMDADEQKKLAAGLERIPQSGFLILHTGTPIIEDGKTKRQSVITTELTNAAKKHGKVIDFGLPRAEDMREWIQAEAARQHKKLAPDAVALLTQLSGDDLQRMGSEIAKAAAHAGDAATITGADVEATLSRGPDDVIFKLCDAVGHRRTAEALGHVSTLFRGGARPDAVAPRALVLLARQIRLLAQFRYLGEQRMVGRNAGPISPEVMALLPADGAGSILTNPRMSWMTDRYVSQARNFTSPELADRLEALLRADLALKGIVPGGDSPQVVMQRLVVELC